MEPVLDLNFEDATAPAVGEGFADVELADGGVFGTLHDLENVAPWQLRNRLLRNWASGELAGEYFHRQKVTRRQSAHIRELLFQVGGEAVDDFGAPGGFLLAGEDNFPSPPVGFDDDGIGHQDGANAGAAEVGLYFLKRGGVALRQRRSGGRGREYRFGPGATTGEAGVIRFCRAVLGWLFLTAHTR